LITNSRRKKSITVLLVVISFLAAQVCFLILPNVFEAWNAKIVDQLFLFRSSSASLRPAYDETVVHVDINNSAVQQLNNFYMNRTYYAQAIRNLAAMGTSAQMYDFIFAAPANEHDDRTLIEATSRAGNVYFGLALSLSREGSTVGKQKEVEGVKRYLEASKWKAKVVEGDGSSLYTGSRPLSTFPALAAVSKGLGYLSIKPDPDGVFRRVPLLVRFGDGFYPSFAFRAVCDYLSVPPERILVRPGRDITLKDGLKPGTPAHDIVIPIDESGNMRINYIGPWERMKHYSFAEIYRASEDREEMRGWAEELAKKIVLVSDVSTGASDTGPVPTDVDFPLSGLHANAVHTILSENFLHELTGYQARLTELILTLFVLLLSLHFSSLPFSLGTIALAACYATIGTLAFFYGNIIFHFIKPLFVVGFEATLVATYRFFNEEKEKAAYRKTLEAYFPPAIVKKIIAHPEMLASSGQKKELTILFSDIKNFTGYSSSLTPGQIRACLNEYFEAMVEIVFRHEGTVDKYIGDGLMVFFGDPEPQHDHALRCVRAAVEMQKRARELKEKWEREGGFPIQVRIGINTGEVVVGNMGSTRRLSYTVLGSDVNLAQRLESNAPVEGILIAERTHELVKDHVPTRPLGQIQVKGIATPVNVYEVLVDA
jgi:adenylate cyclase